MLPSWLTNYLEVCFVLSNTWAYPRCLCVIEFSLNSWWSKNMSRLDLCLGECPTCTWKGFGILLLIGRIFYKCQWWGWWIVLFRFSMFVLTFVLIPSIPERGMPKSLIIIVNLLCYHFSFIRFPLYVLSPVVTYTDNKDDYAFLVNWFSCHYKMCLYILFFSALVRYNWQSKIVSILNVQPNDLIQVVK